MTFLKKIKVNLNYLLGKAEPDYYAPKYRSSKISVEEWKKRWDIFSDSGDGCVWFGVDSDGNVAQFVGEEASVPEAFFQKVSDNKKIDNFFENLPDITDAKLPENLRLILKKHAENSGLWTPLKEAKRGIFIFDEPNDTDWYNTGVYKQFNEKPYELSAMPIIPLKISDLPTEIQELLKEYTFRDLKFRDCHFLEVSKYLYCE